MRFSEWEPVYLDIIADMGYDRSDDEACVRVLKAVTLNSDLVTEDDAACFPDAATERGRKHLRELMDIVRCGERAAMFYLVQRADGRCFAPADFIDPEYADLLYAAVAAGVEIYPYRADISAQGVDLGEQLPLRPQGAA